MAADKISDCIDKLTTSTQASKKKEYLNKLRDLIDDDANQLFLDTCSGKTVNNHLNWQSVFAVCHSFYQERLDDSSKETNPKANLREDALRLVAQVANWANRDKETPYLEYTASATMCLTAARKEISELTQNKRQHLYINLLHDKFISLPGYWSELVTDQWNELVDFCVDVYADVPSTIKNKLINILDICIQIGSRQSMVVLNLKNKFQFFESLLETAEESASKKHLAEYILKMNVSLAIELSLECRFALCKLGEKIMPTIINLTKRDQTNLIKYCNIQMALHHPKGAEKNSSAAYAHDWEKWQRILSLICFMVQTELRNCYDGFKTRVKRNQELTVPTELLELSAEIFKQLFSMDTDLLSLTQMNNTMSLSCPDGPASKRARLEFGILVLIDQLKMAKQAEEICVKLLVLSEFLKKYGTTLTNQEYFNVLQMLVETQSLSRTSMVMNYLCQCCESLLKVVPFSENSAEQEAVRPLWSKIWDMTLRSAGLNQCTESSNSLLQALMQSKLSCFINTDSLLELYLKKSIHLNAHSLQTLVTLATTNHLPSLETCFNTGLASQGTEEASSNWQLILNWLLPGRDEEEESASKVFHLKTSAHLLGEALVRFICKNRITLEKFGHLSYQNEPPVNHIQKIHDTYSVENWTNTPSESPEQVFYMKPQLFDSGREVLTNLLVRDSTEKISSPESSQQNTQSTNQPLEDFHTAVHRAMVHATVLSHLLNLELLDEDAFEDFCITVQTKRLLEVAIPSSFENLVRTARDPFPTKEVLVLDTIYAANYHKTVLEFIRSCTPSAFLNSIFKFCNASSRCKATSFDSANFFSFVEVFHGPFQISGKLTREEEKTVLFTQINSSFCFHPNLKITGRTLEHSLQILRLCHDLVYQEGSPANLQRILLVLKMASLTAKHFNVDHSNFVMESIKELSKRYQRDLAIVSPILNILQGILEYLNTSDHKTHKGFAQAVIKGFKLLIERKRFGCQLRLDLIKCIKRWIELDPEQKWAHVKNVPASLDVLDFIKDPFREVRISTALCLPQIFVPDAPSWTSEQTLSWRKTALDKLVQAVQDSVPNLEGIQAKDDETHNFGTSALKSLSLALIYCPEWRKKTLCSIFQIQKIQKIAQDKVQKAFDNLGKVLDCDFNAFLETNLRYILKYWCSNYNITEFPYALLGCNSAEDFFAKYVSEIVVTLMLLGDTSSLELVAGKLHKSAKDLVISCNVALLSTCLPFITGNKKLDPETMAQLQKCNSLFCKFVDEDEIERILGDNFVEIMFDLYAALHDEPVWQKRISKELVLTLPDYFFIKHSDMQLTLQWIQQKLPDPDNSVMVFLASNHPEYCQLILQKMALRIFGAATKEIKQLFFLQYNSLVEDLSHCLGKKQLGRISAFVVRDIVHMHLNILKSTDTKSALLLAAVCTSLHHLFQECCKSQSQLLEPHLPMVINALVSLIKKNLNTPVAEKAIEIINFVVVTNGNLFTEAICKLEQFPSNFEFTDIQAAYDHIRSKDDHLESEIDHFLAAGKASNGNRVEGLMRLQKQLATRKPQLKWLYEELKCLKEFATATSSLHQLISSLLNLSKSSDEQVALAAASCLGELGPGELMTAVLTGLDVPHFELREAVVQLYIKKIDLLHKYLVDPNSEVCILASEALHFILRTKEGKEALDFFPQPESFFPFQSGSISKTAPVRVNDVKFLTTMDDADTWCPKTKTSHSSWIINLASLILKTISYVKSYTDTLVKLCSSKEEFAESILPPLICFILSNESQECVTLVLQQLQHFFKTHFDMRHLEEKRKSAYISGNKKSVECMLNVVHFLRVNSAGDVLQNMNLLHVAQAAQYCSAHFSCIYYAELHGLSKKISSSGKLKSVDQVCDDSVPGQALHENLINSYKSIADPDAIYGCGMSRMLDNMFQERYFEHCKEWDKVLLLQDFDGANRSTASMLQRMAPTMMNLGLHNLLKANLDTVDCEKMRDAQLQCCWRLGQWDQPTLLEMGHVQDASFESSRYSALKSLQLKDFGGLEMSLELGKKAVINSLKQTNLESIENIYSALSKLQMVQEIKDAAELMPEDFLEKWQQQNLKSDYRFEYLEPILAQRSCLVNILRQTHSDSPSIDEENLQIANAELLLKVSKIARSEKYFRASDRALNELSNMRDIGKVHDFKLLLEKASSFWDQGNVIFAKHILASLVAELKVVCSKENRLDLTYIQAIAMRTYGSWLVDTGSENSRVIIEEYLMPAVKIFKNGNDLSEVSEKVDTFRVLATFADSEYQRVVKCMNSPNFKAKVAHTHATEQSVAALDNATKRNADRDLKTAISVNTAQSNIDRSEIEAMNTEKNDYLKLALDYYVNCLSLSDERVSTVFRVISLLLENKEVVCKLDKVPSYKFIPVIPQLTPHLKTSKDTFQAQISALLMRLAEDHPHHTLPHILALKFAALDHEFEDSVKPPANEARANEAENMIKKLKSKSSLKQIIHQLEKVTTSVVELAYYSQQNVKQMSTSSIPDVLNIRKISKFDQIQVATSTLAIQKNLVYKPNGVLRYEPKFTLVGGIHAPKKIVCVSMDGEKHIQLCKGLDDLHLDAVMQQVFTIMNRMFLRSPGSSNRKLCVRTYNVCPLSQRSGLIEWCKNTIPIGTYLVNAHPKHNPGDALPMKCRTSMNQCEQDLKNKEKRLRTFQSICTSFRPVFHNFFLEHFLLPAEWFVRRLAYTRSVATSSMIGYVLGLGDRHVQNILIDTTTAEVIHIDFGICFEQGLVLRIPELVPFRLSRDIEAGFGISGTEGVFKKSCEAALQVLRDNQATVQSILQVLLYNPMYVWTIPLSQNQNNRSGIKGNRVNRSSDEANQLAERALQRLQEKLMGTEEGMANSVEGQVNRLIQKARDPQNLALMFSGWQPYL